MASHFLPLESWPHRGASGQKPHSRSLSDRGRSRAGVAIEPPPGSRPWIAVSLSLFPRRGRDRSSPRLLLSVGGPRRCPILSHHHHDLRESPGARSGRPSQLWSTFPGGGHLGHRRPARSRGRPRPGARESDQTGEMKFLLLNQTFYPDVMATGQYLTEVAVRLVERGHQVTVVTSQRAYDQPETRFPKTETWRGIRIYRVGSTGFGKGAKWRRAADFASFIVACCWRLAWLPKHDTVVALTTPPLISFIGAWLARFWRASFFYWVMDFNPDQAITAGWLRADSLPARLLERMSRFSLRQAEKVIALDRFMRDRIVAKGIPPAKVVVIPPWSHDAEVKFDPEGRVRFRKAHGLDGKFVVMYSGTHSPCHPLDTLLAAARRLATDPGIVFLFVGGGSEWRKIAETQKPETR